MRRKNILISTSDRTPKLIDFGTAIALKDSSSWLRRSLWRKTRRIDRLQFAKLKKHYLPGTLSQEETDWLESGPWYYRAGSFLRANVYRPLKRRNWSSTLQRLGILPKKKKPASKK